MKSKFEQTKDAREWTLPLVTLIVNDGNTANHTVRVIEYSAYKNLQKQNEILIEALNKTSYISQEMIDCDRNSCCSVYSYEDYQFVAREALAKIEKDER